uniref:Uncharacterized protein n=1 Tax=Physcomitrium patens TaxID=3218 RepID=A0A2K1II15_PHYPA|nr:hypothetical protein PHYPA_027614 [Physcomitrium patens]
MEAVAMIEWILDRNSYIKAIVEIYTINLLNKSKKDYYALQTI